MLSAVKPKMTKYINVIAKPFTIFSPDLLTIIGIIFPILFFYFLSNQNYFGAFLALIGSAFDTLDGAVARMTNRVSKFGAFLDSTMDRLSDSIVIISFYYASLVRVDFVFAALISSLLISYIRSRAELAGNSSFVLNIGVIERTERIILIALATLLAFYKDKVIFGCTPTETIFVVLVTLSIITIVQRTLKTKKLLN